MLSAALANVIKIEGIAEIIISGLFSSKDIHLKEKLESGIMEYLPPGYPEKVQVITGISTSSDCACASCLLMNQDYFDSLSFE